ncbi:hypothetical protein GGR51DRAFT_503591 [Nemania sp. FL0031]|nr:hypothetical protein GGR51DRAFT_503591 [Nemania sp. FL0031]
MASQKEYTVVVTAAAPFKDNKENPTQNVKLKIPDRIEREGRIPINVIKYHFDFRNVITDMDIIPTLWNREKKVYDESAEDGDKIYVDAMLHMGMNFSDIWRIESRARRDGYEWVGDDGVPLPKYNGGEGGRFEGLPEVLKPMFNIDDMEKRVQEELPEIPVKSSTDAGLLYCELILYNSLAALYRRKEKARVMFLHQAGKKTEELGIEQGAKVATAVICSMIDQIESE